MNPTGRPDESLDGILIRPAGADVLLLLAHGAGAGMRHPFMERVARAFEMLDVATLRYDFPYMSAGSRRPDPPKRLVASVSTAAEFAKREYPDLPLFAGGKSLGGRMTSTAVSEGRANVRGLVFFGFPLHAVGRPGAERARHLEGIRAPMLFLQGTRDKLADIDLMRALRERLIGRSEEGTGDITLHEVDGGDHSFKVPKRSGRTDTDVIADLTRTAAEWMRARV